MTPIPERIKTDPTRLRQILTNVVANAIKFTEVGRVSLSLSFVPGETPALQVDIRDTGIGIDDAHRSHLFSPFSQADASTTRRYGGSGLGLSISRRLATLLGGNVELVESTLGLGSVFRVQISAKPLSEDFVSDLNLTAKESIDRQTQRDDAKDTPLNGVRILLAEDGPDNQRLISFMLKKAGAEVEIVENGRLAIDAALSAVNSGRPFDVILMDMQMPILDGYQATSRLRAMSYKGTVIALTAHALTGDREKCLHAGCSEFATKPLNRRRLIELIASQIRTREQVRHACCDAESPMEINPVHYFQLC